jgi:hypothetical protein
VSYTKEEVKESVVNNTPKNRDIVQWQQKLVGGEKSKSKLEGDKIMHLWG